MVEEDTYDKKKRMKKVFIVKGISVFELFSNEMLARDKAHLYLIYVLQTIEIENFFDYYV